MLLLTMWVHHHLAWMPIRSTNHLRVMVVHLTVIHNCIRVLSIRTHHKLILLQSMILIGILGLVVRLGVGGSHGAVLVYIHLVRVLNLIILLLDMTGSGCLIASCRLTTQRVLVLELLLLLRY
jgi:hypothetical protein